MGQGVFGMSVVTFAIVFGVPVVIIFLLALWGLSFDAKAAGRSQAADNEPSSGEGSK